MNKRAKKRLKETIEKDKQERTKSLPQPRTGSAKDPQQLRGFLPKPEKKRGRFAESSARLEQSEISLYGRRDLDVNASPTLAALDRCYGFCFPGLSLRPNPGLKLANAFGVKDTHSALPETGIIGFAPATMVLTKKGSSMPVRKVIPGFITASLALTFSFALACTSGSTNRATNASNSAPAPAATTQPPAGTTPKAKLNLNAASEADFLGTIPGLGNKMVHEFEEYRPYKSIQQFRKEIGKYVGQDQVSEYEKYVFAPIDANQSDAASLQQIPGLEAAEAQELIAGRPYASRDAFLTKLGARVSADELAIAKTYVTQP